MQFLRILKKDFRKAFSSVFFFSISIMFLILIVHCTSDVYMINNLDQADVMAIFAPVIVNNNFYLLYLILAIIPSIHIYSQELKSGNIIFSYNRISKKKYLISKSIVSFVSSFLVIVIPIVIIYSILVCFIKVDFTDNNVVFLTQSEVKNTFEYMILKAVAKGLNVGFYSTVCLLAVNVVNNIFIISTVPVVFNELLVYLINQLSIPQYLSPSALGWGFGIEGDFVYRLTYISIYFISLSIITSCIFVFFATRKEV